MTRAELMRHALSQALRRVHVGPKKLKQEPRADIESICLDFEQCPTPWLCRIRAYAIGR